MPTNDNPIDALHEGLARLDARLESALAQAEAAFGSGPDAAPYSAYRGLVLDGTQVHDLLAREADTPRYSAAPGDPAVGEVYTHPLTRWLAATFALTTFDVDALFVALAVEVDRRYERIYAYLQDDVTQKRPALALALDLLCAPGETRTARLGHFAPDAPLLAGRLLHLQRPDRQTTQLGQTLHADEQVTALFTGQRGLTPALADSARLFPAVRALAGLPLADDFRRGLEALIAAEPPLQLYLQGTVGAEQAHVAEGLAGALDLPLLAADLGDTPGELADFRAWLEHVFRAAWFQNAALYLARVDALGGGERLAALYAKLAHDQGVTILSGEAPWPPSRQHVAPVLHLKLDAPPAAIRLKTWQEAAARLGLVCDAALLDEVARRFVLTPTQIDAAANHARQQARWRAARQQMRERITQHGIAGDDGRRLEAAELFAAVQAQSDGALAALAEPITPRYGWEDIILPDDALVQLHELTDRVRFQPQVLDEWGFGRKHARGRGVAALFAGPSGTGKTMAAEIVARQLGLALYRIDLSSVVSKYIGETEKNLKQIFEAARQTHAILFFDEADAIFGRRSEVRDAHDRYANIEISFLLQQMESYDGVAILATNLRENLDQAFVRRLAFAVHFPFPDEDSRVRIWQSVWTPETPLAADVDFVALANMHRLSGGNIKNVALAAAHLAAAGGSAVTLAHVQHAVRREMQKLGRRLADAE
ncbi:MAG: AAA family ATPase [Anaerolineae bacterium]|nr:AAA family ATPase [Anaerolineae bacterium]